MNLVLYLKLGMQLKKIHRVLAFKQETFFKSYTDFCTAKRSESSSEFVKRLFKLFVNSTFGKTIQNMRKLLECKFCHTQAQVRKHLANPRYMSLKIITEGLVIIFLRKNTVVMNKPFACGFTILERSKCFMYEKYYETIKPILGDCNVLMSDTDSLILEVKNRKKTDNILKLYHIIDFSNYPQDHPNFSNANKNQLGFFKDELCSDKMTSWCGLRSKTYAYELNNPEKNDNLFKSKCKGVTRSYRQKLTFENYKKCVLTYESVHIKQVQMRSKTHCIYTAEISKLAFSSFDDKRYLLNCGIHSLPYGSALIPSVNDQDYCPLCKVHNPLQVRYGF